jgi:hypothetical protein
MIFETPKVLHYIKFVVSVGVGIVYIYASIQFSFKVPYVGYQII